MTRIYLDTAPVIYAVEQVAPFASQVDKRLSEKDSTLITSDLTRLECRVKPMRDDDLDLLNDYDDFFAQIIAEIVPVSRQILDRATLIRAQYGFRTPDAIHLATALASNCEVFLTNDHRLDRFSEILVEIVHP